MDQQNTESQEKEANDVLLRRSDVAPESNSE
jgi:hypothetical protein